MAFARVMILNILKPNGVSCPGFSPRPSWQPADSTYSVQKWNARIVDYPSVLLPNCNRFSQAVSRDHCKGASLLLSKRNGYCRFSLNFGKLHRFHMHFGLHFRANFYHVMATHLESYPPGQDMAKRYVRVWTWYRHVCTCVCKFMDSWTCMYMVCTCTWYNAFVCTMYIHVHAFIYLYVHGTYKFMNADSCIDIVQTRPYSFTTTVTLHFPSGPISFCDASAKLSVMYTVCTHLYSAVPFLK